MFISWLQAENKRFSILLIRDKVFALSADIITILKRKKESVMSMDVNGVHIGQANATRQCDPAKKAQMLQKFEDEKAEALSAAQNAPGLISKISAITPHKGAIEELEAIIVQATQSQTSQNVTNNRTIGMA
jgi:hypothetical protein